jgi:hypothetical protein
MPGAATLTFYPFRSLYQQNWKGIKNPTQETVYPTRREVGEAIL